MTAFPNNGIEVLAPAGNFDSLRAAVINGADAVYLGASAFSARAKAGNFSYEQLCDAVRYCHLFSVKVYLAVNTVIKPNEYDEALKMVNDAILAKVDAIIVQDLAFLSLLHSTMPHIVVHLSTQAGVHNTAGAIVAEKLGAKRVILSREARLNDIREIHKTTNLEIEYFVHGALCVAFSGNCYFSSLATGLSGNRGKCLQFCRKKYSCKNKEGYLLSAKDLDESNRIYELIDAGVTSFKIEGRMRRAEYVAEATRHYKALLSGCTDSDKALKTLFNRGDGCNGYLNNPTENIIYPNIQAHMGTTFGTVKSITGKTAIIASKSPLHTGDGVKFIRNGVETGSASILTNGYKTGFEGDVKVGDTVNITTDKLLLDEINQRTRKIDVKITFSCRLNSNAVVIASTSDGISLTVKSDFLVQSALNAPINADSLEECFRKTGDTEFVLSEIKCDIPKNAFIVKSALNSFRREVYEKLENAIVSEYEKRNNLIIDSKIIGNKNKSDDYEYNDNYPVCDDSLRFKRNAPSVEQTDNYAKNANYEKNATGNEFDLLKTVLPQQYAPNNTFTDSDYLLAPQDELTIFKSNDIDFLIAAAEEYDAAIFTPHNYADATKLINAAETKTKKRFYLDMPVMLREKDNELISEILSPSGVKNVIINNIGELELCKTKNYILGSAMNIVNPQLPARKVMSIEYDGREFGDNYVYIFGKYPIMTFAHCPKKTLNGGKCLHCNQESIQFTEKSGVFDIMFYKVGYCYARMLNCVPTCAFDLCKSLKIKRKIIDFIGIPENQRATVIEAYKKSKKPPFPITRAYFNKKLD